MLTWHSALPLSPLLHFSFNSFTIFHYLSRPLELTELATAKCHDATRTMTQVRQTVRQSVRLSVRLSVCPLDPSSVSQLRFQFVLPWLFSIFGQLSGSVKQFRRPTHTHCTALRVLQIGPANQALHTKCNCRQCQVPGRRCSNTAHSHGIDKRSSKAQSINWALTNSCLL